MANTPAVKLSEQLKSQGYRIKTSHVRRFRLPLVGYFYGTRKEHPAVPPEPNGGSTVVTVYDSDGNRLVSAVARCSLRDNYNKKLGATIALGRAYSLLNGKNRNG